ncbi:hypothetical protein M378DRAFT_58642, partial [Amanita muscaria Koide BX008]
YNASDPTIFPGRVKSWPNPVMVDGVEEYPVEGIIDERRCDQGMRYLVHFVDQPPSEDCWLPESRGHSCRKMRLWTVGSP